VRPDISGTNLCRRVSPESLVALGFRVVAGGSSGTGNRRFRFTMGRQCGSQWGERPGACSVVQLATVSSANPASVTGSG